MDMNFINLGSLRRRDFVLRGTPTLIEASTERYWRTGQKSGVAQCAEQTKFGPLHDSTSRILNIFVTTYNFTGKQIGIQVEKSFDFGSLSFLSGRKRFYENE